MENLAVPEVAYWPKKSEPFVSPITVYVAGPIALGDQIANCGRAIRFGHELHTLGFVPYVPHWAIVQQMYSPWTPDEWLEYDFVWLDKCETLFRLSGESKGADLEVARAKRLGLPVFYELAELLEYRRLRLCA